ncbi:EamA family transporter [Clostridium tunisiense]|uniref:EamA family transporter n=1 Tax=Clostridium tunisiense TaxID=219748 RepID=UPI00037378A8
MINTLNLMLLLTMTILGAFAGLFLKKASSSPFKSLILNINLYLGGGLYFLSALINIYILKYLDYSVVLPLTSMTYIWTMLISFFILHEKISVKKIIGIALILVGALCVAIG